MLVEIFSDVVCPWCYVGKARFEQALERLAWRDEIEVVFRPFELDPTVPRGGVPIAEYYGRKFGNPRAIDAMDERVGTAARELDLRFDLRNAVRANTHDSHRLLCWALAERGSGPQGAVKQRLMEAYFAEAADLGDHTTLARLAGEAGLDTETAAEVLASGAYEDEVQEARRDARDRDIHAVPTFVLADAIAIPGAQDPDTIATLLERVRTKLAG